jgi:alpha-D-ribose 1-methylphosphonate 5-phosphate C-P lyase
MFVCSDTDYCQKRQSARRREDGDAKTPEGAK